MGDEHLTTWVILGGGPSLTPADVDFCRGRARVIAVNNAYALAPWADYLYARDFDWWASIAPGYAQPHHVISRTLFHGKRITGSEKAARAFGLVHVPTRGPAGGLSPFGAIHEGPNGGQSSGYQALNFAFQELLIAGRGGKIALLGFDMGATGDGHWHGAHPAPLVNVGRNDYGPFARAFDTAKRDAAIAGIDVVNISRASAITAFRFGTIEHELQSTTRGVDHPPAQAGLLVR